MEKNKGELLRGNTMLPRDETPKLKELGIDKMQSSRWQRIASVPEEEFESRLENIRQSNHEITTAGVLALGRGVPRNGAASTNDGPFQAFVAAGTRFGTVYADPPWDDRHHASRMTVNQLSALPVEAIAAEDAHLHVWTTDAHLFDSKRVIEAWGFKYAGCFVWIKPAANVGNHWSVAHEFLLLGVRGASSFLDTSLKSWTEIEPTQDGRKPEVVRQMIERASPGPRIELFARGPVDGWTNWDNRGSQDAEVVDAELVDGELSAEKTNVPDAIETSEGDVDSNI